ncbi:MAG: family 1 glycosylhydrolase [Myxococcota bacterium]|nr:family 1 glycosylhydrolase [Myxococcota bacterium]
MSTLLRLLGLSVTLAVWACDPRPHFPEEVDPAVVGTRLPPGFLLGAATSSHQVEGGNVNDWTDWENSSHPDGTPHVRNGEVSGQAVDSWNRFSDDLGALRHLGANGYRLSVEWSRLEPNPGEWNSAAADRYLDWMVQLRAGGIEPMVTLSHFTLPRWVAAQGGWESPQIKHQLAAFAGRVAALLGGQVDLWVTINEPNALAVQGYLVGLWPPGKTDQAAAAQVLFNQLEAHVFMREAVRINDTADADGDGAAARVGLVHHGRVLQPASSSVLDSTIAALADDFANEVPLRAARTGRIQINIPPGIAIDEEIPGLKDSFDFLGLNYYFRSYVRADLGLAALSIQYSREDRPQSDLGWELYPEGMYLMLHRFASVGVPIYVTENGMADASGEVRPQFLLRHFDAMERAIADGVDVRGYLHWSLLHNFEWSDGWHPDFGLFAVDRTTFQRSPTPAVETLRRIAVNAGLSPEDVY